MNPTPIQTCIPVQGMIICAAGGEFVKHSDHERALKDTGFVDRKGVRIFEGDKVNFSTRGHPHGPEREDYSALEVYWDQKAGCWLFDRGLSLQMMDGIVPESLEVVP